MRRVTLVGISGLVLLLMAAGASAAHGRHPAPHHPASAICSPGRGHVVVANAQSQLYVTENKFSEHEIYGCVYDGKRAYGLGPLPESGTSSGGGGVEQEVLAGPIVAYEEFSITNALPLSGGPSSWLVIVRNLRTGGVLHKVPTGTSTSPEGVGGGFTSSIVVKSDGAVAWIVTSGVARGGNQVHIVDQSGSRIVASGTDVDPQSLALAGSTLYWTQEGKSASSTLN